MEERYTINIIVKPFLKHFLETLHGKPNGKIYIPKKEPLCRFLNLALIKRPVNARQEDPEEEESIIVILPYFEWHSPIVYNYLTKKSVNEFNCMLEDLFWVTFSNFSNKYFLDGLKVSIIPHLFIKHYNLPDDPALENNLMKYIYRHQKKHVKAPIRNYKKGVS